MDTIEEKVKKIIVSTLNVNSDDVTRGALFDDLGGDSLDTIEIIMGVEDILDQEISDKEAESMVSLGTICEFFESQDNK
tara:strand:+ start:2279 stop:2515 length:237 start_codon:yes stop_codon:yes gene_type:complete